MSSMLWVIGGILLAAVAVPLIVLVTQQLKRERLLTRAGLSEHSKMNLPDFLRYLETLFGGLGYRVEKLPSRDDGGLDLVLVDGTGRRTAVLARRWKERIDRSALQRVAEGAAYHQCEDTLVLSIAGYQNNAIAMAEETGAFLWGAEDLADAMEKVRTRPSFQPAERARTSAAIQSNSAGQPKQAAALQTPTVDQVTPQTPLCPHCRSAMAPRVAAGREIWLCSRFPRCNGARMKEGQV